MEVQENVLEGREKTDNTCERSGLMSRCGKIATPDSVSPKIGNGEAAYFPVARRDRS